MVFVDSKSFVDTLGSVRQIADANGAVTLAKSYEPYGSVLTSTGTASSIFGYSGEVADTTGLIYLRARYMSPGLGMFTSRDPWSGDEMRPGSMNGFGYVGGNPINFTDPMGLQEGIVICQQNPQLCETVRQAVEAGVATVVGVVETSATTTLVTVGGVAVGGMGIIILALFSPQREVWPPPVRAPTAHPQPRYAPPPTLSVGDPGGTTGRSPAPRQQQPPKPEPNPEPVRIRDPFPWATCTPTKEPLRKHIALGLNFSRDPSRRPILFQFNWNLNQALNPQNIYVYTYGDWQSAGLSSDPAVGDFFSEAFDQAATKAERIHFNLEDINNPNEFALKYGAQGQFKGDFRFPAVELYRIKARPDLCAKTNFYDNSNLVPSTQRICGNP